jgi:3-hydroxyisobutyrate dehydrogenase
MGSPRVLGRCLAGGLIAAMPADSGVLQAGCWTTSPGAVPSPRSSTPQASSIAKDIAVVRGIAAELGSDLGVLDGVIDAGGSGAK